MARRFLGRRLGKRSETSIAAMLSGRLYPRGMSVYSTFGGATA
jgi:hypothetical protein